MSSGGFVADGSVARHDSGSHSPSPPSVGSFTLTGWELETGITAPGPRARRRVARAYLWVGAPAGVVAASIVAATWHDPTHWTTVASLGILALAAQLFPVQVSRTQVSVGVGFLIAVCLLEGAAIGGATAAAVLAFWPALRTLAPWTRPRPPAERSERLARWLFATSAAGLVYTLATLAALHLTGLSAPVTAVSARSVAATAVLAVGVFLLHNTLNFVVVCLAGPEARRRVSHVIPKPALAELLAIPAALLLAVTAEGMGQAAFGLLASLCLLAAFLGWRSWQDRESLRRRLAEVELLQRAGAALAGSLEMGDVVRRLAQVIREVASARRILLMLDDTGERLAQVFAFDHTGQRGQVQADEVKDARSRGDGLHRSADGGAVLVRSLAIGDGAIARLRLEFGPDDVPRRDAQSLLDTVLQQAGTALSNAWLFRLTNTDPLTGVAIRRYFERALRAVAAGGGTFATIMLDLDWFKQVNDGFGHRAGDEVLRDLAEVLEGSLRVMDVAARYGGEEFVILLPGASSPEAAAVAERIRRSLEQRRLAFDGRRLRYTASFGVAASVELDQATDPMEVVWLADAALLEAKRAGRNQVVTAASLRGARPRPFAATSAGAPP
jgi:diguanylate cyclase (GGDEF)-like protein